MDYNGLRNYFSDKGNENMASLMDVIDYTNFDRFALVCEDDDITKDYTGFSLTQTEPNLPYSKIKIIDFKKGIAVKINTTFTEEVLWLGDPEYVEPIVNEVQIHTIESCKRKLKDYTRFHNMLCMCR